MVLLNKNKNKYAILKKFAINASNNIFHDPVIVYSYQSLVCNFSFRINDKY